MGKLELKIYGELEKETLSKARGREKTKLTQKKWKMRKKKVLKTEEGEVKRNKTDKRFRTKEKM